MAAAIGLAGQVGVRPACESLGVARASYYRHLRPVHGPRPARPTPLRALGTEERQAVFDQLHSERFRDQPPSQVAAALLDEGQYLCSSRTMYRLLASQGCPGNAGTN